MKLHLPIRLRCALVAACCCSFVPAHAEVAEVFGTVEDFIGSYSNSPTVKTPVYVGDNTEDLKKELETYEKDKLRNVVFSSSGSTEISWGETPVTIGSTLCVREGELIIRDSDITKKDVAANHQLVHVSGKNATLILDNTRYVNTLKNTLGGDVMHIGGHSGAGNLILKNNSEMAVTTWVIVGIASKSGIDEAAGYQLYNTPEGASSGVYKGDFRHSDGAGTAYMRNLDYGTGTITISSGSSLTVDGFLSLKDGIVTVTGAGSTLTTGHGSNMPSTNIHNDLQNDLLGRSAGAISIVKIEDGGVWNTGGNLGTGTRDVYESKVLMYVDGSGSQINVGKNMRIGYGANGSPGAVTSTQVYITNGGQITVGEDMSLGVPSGKIGANPSYVYIDGDSSIRVTGTLSMYAPTAATRAADGTAIIYPGNKYNGKVIVNTTGFETELVNEGSITCATMEMNDGNLHNSGTIDVSGTLTLKGGNITLGLSDKYATKAAISAGSVKVATADGSDYEVLVTVTENLKAGKYMLMKASGEEVETAATFSRAAVAPGKVKFILPEEVNGMSLVMDEEGNAILTLSEQVLLTLDPLANAVQAANWGVQKSSQAFTSLLWQPRSAAAEVRTDSVDSKGMSVPAAPSSRTVAWGSAYSGFSSLSTSGNFCGADYSLYGGAIGVERQCAKGSSIGVALGYDWGKTSPHAVSRVNQDTMHAALYGRALNRKLGSKSSVALDWSAAVGNTTSEHDQLGSDWEQKSMQLDARATYGYELTNRTTLSGFAGAQYYAQESASTSRIHASSMQNLRLMLGGGVSYKATERTTLYGEATIYNDTMRHNPTADLDGFYYGNGTNPGRLGGSISVGAQYQLNDKWSINGNYTYEGADNSDEQRVNVGASYTF